MSCSIQETLLNAKVNFQNLEIILPVLSRHPVYKIAKSQLDNALDALTAGKSADEDVLNEGQEEGS